MELIIKPRGGLEINGARICRRNFSGLPDDYTPAGKRNFTLIIAGGTLDDGRTVREVDAAEMAEALQNTVNRYGDGYNVKISIPENGEGDPFITLKVQVSAKSRDKMPPVFLNSAGKINRLTDPDDLNRLDRIAIREVNMDIRPYDDERMGRTWRAAYLDSMEVVQEIDRFTARYAEEEYPEE